MNLIKYTTIPHRILNILIQNGKYKTKRFLLETPRMIPSALLLANFNLVHVVKNYLQTETIITRF